MNSDLSLNSERTPNKGGRDLVNLEMIRQGKLWPSVRLYTGFKDTDPDRIFLSAGVCPAAPFSRPEAKYYDVAYLPREPWRRPTLEEAKLLITDEVSSPYSTCVGLIQVPQDLLEPFSGLGMDKIKTREEYDDLMKQPPGNAAVEGFADFVRSFLVKEDSFRIIRIFNRPGLVTATYGLVNKQELFTGLHVDYTEKQPMHGRDKSPNRISLNLGQEDRHFIFINLSINDLIEIVNPPPHYEPEQLVFDFLAAYPQYPVIKVRIRPGEAYIAPTQNLIHDGMASKNTADFNLTIIGHIALAPTMYQMQSRSG